MLVDLDQGLVNHFVNRITLADSRITNSNLFISLVNDDSHILRLYEQLRARSKLSNQVSLPFVCLLRGQLRHDPGYNPGSSPLVTTHVSISDNRVIGTEGYGTALVSEAVQCEIDYTLIWYDDDYTSLSDFVEKWFLRVGRSYTLFNFTIVGLANNTMTATFRIEDPSTTSPSILEKEDSGIIYKQEFPFTVTTFILKPVESAKLILYPYYRILIDDTVESTNYV